MDIFARTKDIFGGEISPYEIRVEILAFKNVGIFGSHKVVFFSNSEISLSCKNCEVRVLGENLKVARLEKDEIYISGEIASVEKIHR